MKLDMKFVKKESFYCMEKIIATISGFWGRHYEMIFLNSIKSYDVCNVEEFVQCLTEEPYFNNKEMMEYLERFHGIQLYNFKCNTVFDALKFIESEILNNRPVVIAIDILCLPWLSEKDYMYYAARNMKGFNSLIITGMEEGMFHCFDVHYSNCEQMISYEDLKKGAILTSVTGVRMVEDEKFIENNKEILNNRIQILFEKNKYGFNVFQQTRLLSENLSSFEVYKEDFEQYGYKQLSYVKGCINKLYRSRYLFSFVLEYMADVVEDDSLKKLSNYYKEVVSIWYTAFLLAYRASVKKSYSVDCIQRISSHICDASIREEKIMKSIIALDIPNISSKPNCDDLEYKDGEGCNSFYIPLDSYFNDNSFLCAYDGLEDVIFSEEYLIKDDYKFRLSRNIYNTDLDIVSCKGQKIEIPLINGHKLRILGYGVDGNFSGVGKLVYDDEYVEEFIIEFSRYEIKPNCDIQYKSNQVMWEGKRNDKDYDMTAYISKRRNMRILAMDYHLKNEYKLTQIVLPEISNIHILAITVDI